MGYVRCVNSRAFQNLKSPWRKVLQRRLMMEVWLWGACAVFALRGKGAKSIAGRAKKSFQSRMSSKLCARREKRASKQAMMCIFAPPGWVHYGLASTALERGAV